MSWRRIGHFDDPRKKQVRYFEKISFNDIVRFQKRHIVEKPMVISLFTDQSRVDTNELSKYGQIIILDKKDYMN